MRLTTFIFLLTTLLMGGNIFTHAQDNEPALLSAFFGLDNALPDSARGICRQAPGLDGMPVIFSTQINPDTLNATDFAVVTQSGVVQTPVCATLSPAIDEGELRTVLLIGELGSDQTDPPVRVEVIGDIQSIDNSVSFLGTSVEVTPLSAGPSIILAELVPAPEMAIGRESGRQQGDGCPVERTTRAVRVTWAGGVSNADGDEASDPERQLYQVTVQQSDGSLSEVTPFALADLGDSDNNHLLCLDVEWPPVSVFFPAGHLYDPNSDAPNPDSTVSINTDGILPANFYNVRYCEVIPTYRQVLMLRSEVYNTLGLNDCPADEWAALDAEALKAELGALNVSLNGPRYWVLDEIAALSGVSLAGERATFGTIEMSLRGVLETRIRGDLVGGTFYTPNTVNRDTRFMYYSGQRIYELVSPAGEVYIMQSYAQIADPTLDLTDLETLGERLSLPEGWSYQSRVLDSVLVVASGGQATVINDEFYNSYQLVR